MLQLLQFPSDLRVLGCKLRRAHKVGLGRPDLSQIAISLPPPKECLDTLCIIAYDLIAALDSHAEVFELEIACGLVERVRDAHRLYNLAQTVRPAVVGDLSLGL